MNAERNHLDISFVHKSHNEKSETIGSFIKNATKKQIQIHTGGFCTKSVMSRFFATMIIFHKMFTMLEHCGTKSMLRRSLFNQTKLQTSILRRFCTIFVPISSATKNFWFTSRINAIFMSKKLCFCKCFCV